LSLHKQVENLVFVIKLCATARTTRPQPSWPRTAP